MSMQPEWNFETVKEVKPKNREPSPPASIAIPPQPVSPRANTSTPPAKQSFVQKEKNPKKDVNHQTAPQVEVDQRSTALYEVIAPILLELKNQPRYQHCVR